MLLLPCRRHVPAHRAAARPEMHLSHLRRLRHSWYQSQDTPGQAICRWTGTKTDHATRSTPILSEPHAEPPLCALGGSLASPVPGAQIE